MQFAVAICVPMGGTDTGLGHPPALLVALGRALALYGHRYCDRGRPVAGRAPLVSRRADLALLDDALREAVSGTGSVVFLVGEPGLGKTRLVHECRKRFMAWVGAGTGRLPLWLEGGSASYASSTPYGLYQQLLYGWTGAAPEEGEDVLRPGLERAMRPSSGAKSTTPACWPT